MMKRNTIQRTLVLEAVNSLRCHATADEVYTFISRSHPHISKGTVYRNLNQLSEKGEIKKIEIAGDKERFDHICGNHYHIKCTKCGKVFDVEMDYITDLDKHIKDTHGFLIESHNLVFSGICPDCVKGQPK